MSEAFTWKPGLSPWLFIAPKACDAKILWMEPLYQILISICCHCTAVLTTSDVYHPQLNPLANKLRNRQNYFKVWKKEEICQRGIQILWETPTHFWFISAQEKKQVHSIWLHCIPSLCILYHMGDKLREYVCVQLIRGISWLWAWLGPLATPLGQHRS